MASYTPNYNLKKPADSDSYDIADENGNMDIIDTQLNALNSKMATDNVSLTSVPGSVLKYVFKKKDNWRSLYMELIGWDTTNTTVLGVVPSGSRPSDRRCIVAPIIDPNATSAVGTVLIIIQTNGNIEIASMNAPNQRFTSFYIDWTV